MPEAPEPADPADSAERPAHTEPASAPAESKQPAPTPDDTVGPDDRAAATGPVAPAQQSPTVAPASAGTAPNRAHTAPRNDPGETTGTAAHSLAAVGATATAGSVDASVWSRNPGTTGVAISGGPHRGPTGDQRATTWLPGPLGPQPRAAGHPMPAPAAPPRWRRVAHPAGVLPAATGAGLVAAATLSFDRPGIGWLLAGSATAVAVGTVHRRAAVREDAAAERHNRPGRWWAVAALALLAVGTFRAAGWLFVLCLIAAAVAGSLAVVGRPSARGVLHDAIAVPLASAGAFAWVYAAQATRRGGTGARHRRLAVSVAATMVLLAVFVPLLAGADATFAAMVEGLVPRLDAATLTGWIVAFLLVGTATLGALYVLAGPPAPADQHRRTPKRTLARLEWGLPVGALTVLFALFVGAQLMALFGGDDYVQRTAGLTYADYARGGFWQLAAVTLLTLAIILPVLHRAASDSATDRGWLRGLLCTISGLTLVIIASALGRMWTYQQAYGFTVLRLLVGTCELWLGIVYLLVIVAVLRLRTAWLPRTAVATAVAALLSLAALNPEALVASENIDRWQRGEELDVDYLSGLSADVVPVLDRLPEPLRTDLRHRLTHRLDDETWSNWNLARMRAAE
ncbi:DUF4153 domain-containing protein [Nocardia sp. NPDC052254]|uniref:DUF4153 domain-containing protein n=1 Tax=Nocardia sp. NPDC052254 TaxID=3155681 RepID=UPI00343AA04C